ncbi:crotonobetaine/carnitine-CoA ligase [Sphingopyxis panaciterrae]|uniref:AMP-binding protein n=1 Tax=Sphingopyxis panaciterrae TaxID=363841 RepID=UPI001420B1C4|nr:AMP-binding protein [Sphingopyxis panaciterrae]NIJ35948.1 crotonobetaine/carnitine-CoA ligase [Sphingopyxis panaciterrae]
MSQRVNDIARLIEQKAAERPDFPILTFVHVEPDGSLSDETRDFRSLWDRGQRLAAWLQAYGVKPGDSIILMMTNRPQFVEAMVAAALAGAAFVPLDTRSMGDKLAYMINHVAAKAIIAEDAALAALDAVAAQLDRRPPLLVVDSMRMPEHYAGSSYAADLPADAAGLAPQIPDPAAPMYLMFTSGTTGNPKAVVRSHANYMRGMKGLRALGVGAGDTLYTGLPLCHTNAHSTLAAGLALELPTVFSRQFTKSRLWDICRAYDCTMFTLLGGMIPEVFAVPPQPGDRDNPVRLVIASGMPAKLWEAYETRFGVQVTEVYGSTENGGTLINRMGEGPRGSMGKPPPGMIAAILDDDDQICPPGEPGHLCFRKEDGASDAITYFRNEKASADKVVRGWFRSGDMAYADERGWFYFLHRAGGGIRRNGDFVNATLVETVLAQCPAVADVYVYGVATPANVAGERTLVAALVLEPGGSLDTVRQWAAERLQRSEVPEIWQLLAAIPKTVSEKPIERDCAALLEAAGLVERAATENRT